MSANCIKLSRLKVGDIFCYRGVIYEVVIKNAWTTTCRYANDAKTPKYMYCDFNNYIKVEI